MIYFDSLDSTNSYAKASFDTLDDGELVAAGQQTAGRGRLGRKWTSSPGNIFASFVIRGIDNPFLGVVSCSLAALDLVRSLCPEHPFYIKWPNDIFYHRSKIAGILAEYVHTSAYNGLIVGIGINIAMTQSELDLVGQPAVSLFSLTGRTANIRSTLLDFEKKLRVNATLLRREPDLVFQRWKSENDLLGKKVDFDTVDGTRITCVFDDIADDGSAIVLLPDGSRTTFNCGDVRLHFSNV